MTPEKAVERARSAIGQGCVYALGRGGMHPEATFPWNAQKECDCSGFAMWALGLSRHQEPSVNATSGLWYDTSRIVHDATHEHALFNAFPWELAAIGDLIVYGDRDGHQGHVGVVCTVNEEGPATVTHCSHGNWTHLGDAIRETAPGPWRLRQDTILARRIA